MCIYCSHEAISDNRVPQIQSAVYSGLLVRALRLMKRSSVLSLVDQAVVSIANFLTGVIIGRTCSKEEFGLYMLGLSILLLANDIQTSLIATSYMVQSPKLKDRELAVYTGSALMHQWALTGCMLLALCIGWLAVGLGFGPEGLETVIPGLVLVFGFILFREFIRRICFARLNMAAALGIDVSVSFLQIVGIGALAFTGNLSAAAAFRVIGFACMVAGIAWLWTWKSRYAIHPTRFTGDLSASWSLGKWVFASGMLWAVSMNIYPWFLASYHGTAATGVWGACLGAVAVANPMLVGVQNYLGPKISTVLAESGIGYLRRFIVRVNILFLGVMAAFCLALFVWGERLVVFMYGGKYSGTGMVVSVLALGLVFSTVGFIYSRTLFAMERADIDFYTNFVALFVLLAAGIPLVRAWGPFGAALGLVTSNFVASGIRLFFVVGLMHRNEKGVTV